MAVKARVLDGILTGLASAGIAGVAWWALASFGQFEEWPYTSVVVGLIVGFGVLLGSRRGGLVSGLIAVVLASVATIVAVYFIDRSLMIAALEDAGRTSDIPLWQGFAYAQDVIEAWIEFDRDKAAGWLLAPIAALIVAGWPNRRPLGG